MFCVCWNYAERIDFCMDYNDNQLVLGSYLPDSVTNGMYNDYDTVSPIFGTYVHKQQSFSTNTSPSSAIINEDQIFPRSASTSIPPTKPPKPRSRSKSESISRSKPVRLTLKRHRSKKQVSDNIGQVIDIDTDHITDSNNKKRSNSKSKSKSKSKGKSKSRKKKVIDTDSNDPGYCHSCRQTFKGSRGLRAHQGHSSCPALESPSNSIQVSISNLTPDPLQSKSTKKAKLKSKKRYVVCMRFLQNLELRENTKIIFF